MDGEVPETIISGQTSDISPIADLEWYEWNKWKDGQASYPEDKLSLGRYLGPSLDVGPAMAIKVLKENGEVIRLSSYYLQMSWTIHWSRQPEQHLIPRSRRSLELR